MLAQHRQAQQADFQAILCQFCKLCLGRLLGDFHGNARMLMQIATEPGQQLSGQRHRARMIQAQTATYALADIPGQALGFLQVHQQCAGPRQEGLAGSRKARLASGAFEQQGLKLRLQLLDLPAQGRLGNEQALGGGAETAAFGDFDEVSQLTGGDHW
ncbi:hypothetical protein D3C78_853800 [compost metagenome]